MRWKRVQAVARKEVIQILRDARSLVVVILMPIILMLLFGYGVSLDIRNVPVYFLDRDRTQASRDLLSHFQASQYFDVICSVDDYRSLVHAIDSGQARLAIVIPQDFARRLNQGGEVGVQAIADATDDNTANVVFGYTEGVLRGFSTRVRLDWLHRQGRTRAEAPLALETRTWFNEDLESRAFIIPGVVAIVMAVIGAFLTSLTIAREWERGTMEQLIATPVTPLEILVGKLAPYFVVGMLDVAICAGMAIAWYRIPFRGSFLMLFASSALFLIVVLGLGYFISVVAKSQLAASQAALVATFLPAFLLSGFLFSIEQMPVVIRAITHVIPARYYVSILKALFLKGPGGSIQTEMLALAIFALVIGVLATRVFHKRLD